MQLPSPYDLAGIKRFSEHPDFKLRMLEFRYGKLPRKKKKKK